MFKINLLYSDFLCVQISFQIVLFWEILYIKVIFKSDNKSKSSSVLYRQPSNRSNSRCLINFIIRSIHCYCERNERLNINFTNAWSQINQIGLIVNHLKLWIAVAKHNFKWVKIQII